jgi:hypothetical protein
MLEASLIWGVDTLFPLDAGSTLLPVLVANAAFSAGIVIFEIPRGYRAARTGIREGSPDGDG